MLFIYRPVVAVFVVLLPSLVGCASTGNVDAKTSGSIDARGVVKVDGKGNVKVDGKVNAKVSVEAKGQGKVEGRVLSWGKIQFLLRKTPKGHTIDYEGGEIEFAYDSAKLEGETTFKTLEGLFSLLRDNPKVKIHVEGHTDSRGSDEYNLELSKRRAQSIKAWLVGKGVDEKRITFEGKGEGDPHEQEPAACKNQRPTDTKPCEGVWGRNRRAELVIKSGVETIKVEKIDPGKTAEKSSPPDGPVEVTDEPPGRRRRWTLGGGVGVAFPYGDKGGVKLGDHFKLAVPFELFAGGWPTSTVLVLGTAFVGPGVMSDSGCLGSPTCSRDGLMFGVTARLEWHPVEQGIADPWLGAGLGFGQARFEFRSPQGAFEKVNAPGLGAWGLLGIDFRVSESFRLGLGLSFSAVSGGNGVHGWATLGVRAAYDWF